MKDAIRLLAGPAARARIARDGLRPQDVRAVAAAAGGPKGLALLPLDRWLFGEWLTASTSPLLLAGASIGAWRMAAAAQRDPLPALDRLREAYLECQRYPLRPTPRQVADTCRQVVREVLGHDAAGFAAGLSPQRRLRVVTARHAAGPGEARRRHFGAAALANLVRRDRLGRTLQRVVFEAGPDTGFEALPADGFRTMHRPLSAANLEDALLASGTIPFLASPVRDIHDAPPGDYWDGGLVDYHLHWRWRETGGLVLIPHFVPHLTAGWLDKTLPWRRHGVGRAARDWLDDVLLVVPGPGLLQALPNGRLPDRKDFHRHLLRHDERIAQWRRAIGQCEAMAEAFAAFVARPDPTRLETLPGR